jgi:hypothetical protein
LSVMLYQRPLLLTCCRRCQPCQDLTISMGWLLTGITSFANWCGLAMAGSSPAMTGVKSRYFRRLVLCSNERHKIRGAEPLISYHMRHESRYFFPSPATVSFRVFSASFR